MKKAGLIVLLRVLVCGLAASPLHAEQASDEDMARSALQSTFRTSNELVLEQRRQEADQRLASRVVDAGPGVPAFLGTVVFDVGVTSNEIERLVAEYDFEVTGAESKIPVGLDGQVVTMSAGGRDLVLLDDFTLAHRLRVATGGLRYRLYQAAMSSDSESEREELLEALKDPDPKYYKLTILADVRTFAMLRDLGSVAVVLPDETQNAARAYLSMARQLSNSKLGPAVMRIGTPFESPLPRPAAGESPFSQSETDEE